MKELIILCFWFTCFLFFVTLLNIFSVSQRRVEKRIKLYLKTSQEKNIEKANVDIKTRVKLFNNKIKKCIPTVKVSNKLEKKISRTGINVKPEEFIVFQWMCLVIIGGTFYIISNNYFAFFVGAIIGYITPLLMLSNRGNKRFKKFNQGLPDLITSIVGSLRAGFSLQQALKTVAEDSESPIRDEINIVIKEIRCGSTLEEALNHLNDRMPSGDLEMMIQSILIQREVGGNLSSVLEIIASTIRERQSIQRQVVSLTAQGKMSGLVIGFLPIGLGVVINLLDPGYMTALFTNKIGVMMLMMGMISEIIGFILINKIVTIEV